MSDISPPHGQGFDPPSPWASPAPPPPPAPAPVAPLGWGPLSPLSGPQAELAAPPVHNAPTYQPPVAPRSLTEMIPDTEYVSPPRRKVGPRLAAAGAASALLLGGLAMTMKVNAASKGAESPEAAVQQMIAAAQNNDVLGMLDSLPASERSLLTEQAETFMGHAKRLGFMDQGVKLNKVEGASITVDQPVFATESITDRIAAVSITGGTYSAMPDRALASKFTDALGLETTDVSVDERGDFGESPLRLATVKDGDGWHVSVMYSIAEAARINDDLPKPTLSDHVEAKGASSAENAVREMIQAVVDNDVRRAIELSPPDEMAALHDYGGLILGGSRFGLDNTNVEIHDMVLDTKSVLGGTKALLTKIDVTVTSVVGEYRVKAQKAGDDCMTYNVVGPDMSDAAKVCAADVDVDNDEINVILRRLAGQLDEMGYVATQVSGQWYVSPVRTYADIVSTLLDGLEEGEPEALFSYVFQTFLAGFSSSNDQPGG